MKPHMAPGDCGN